MSVVKNTHSVTEADGHHAMVGLTGFQRDIITALAHDGPQKGTAIKSALEDVCADEVNHSRLYPNLDTLTEGGWLTKAKRDGRTNEYALTDAGEASFMNYADRLARASEEVWNR